MIINHFNKLQQNISKHIFKYAHHTFLLLNPNNNTSTIFNTNNHFRKSILINNNNHTFFTKNTLNTHNILSISTKPYSTFNNNNTNTKPLPKKKSTNKYFIYFCLLSTSSIYIYYMYISLMKSKQSQHKESIIHTTYKSILNYLNSFHDLLTKPYNSYVLLDKLRKVSDPPEKTLVINLNKTLISYKYSLLNGFQIIQRPGLIAFLKELSKYYEIVLFSNEDITTVQEISNAIDPKKEYISSELGKESTHIVNGKHIKDLNYLNRNLNNVIVLDFDIDNVKLHPMNTIILDEFDGNGKDRELLLLIVFLRDMAEGSIKDVREQIKKWGNYKPYIKYYKHIKKYNKLLPS